MGKSADTANKSVKSEKSGMLTYMEDDLAYYNSYEPVDIDNIADINKYLKNRLEKGYAFVIADVDRFDNEITNLEYFQCGKIASKDKGEDIAGYYYQLTPSYEYGDLDGYDNKVEVASDNSNMTDMDELVSDLFFAFEMLDDSDFEDREIYVSKFPIDPKDENYFGPVELSFVSGWMKAHGCF